MWLNLLPNFFINVRHACRRLIDLFAARNFPDPPPAPQAASYTTTYNFSTQATIGYLQGGP